MRNPLDYERLRDDMQFRIETITTLTELRAEIKALKGLPNRVNELEAFRDKLIGLPGFIAFAIVIASFILSVVAFFGG